MKFSFWLSSFNISLTYNLYLVFIWYFLYSYFLNSATLPIFYLFRSLNPEVVDNICKIVLASFLCWFFLMLYRLNNFWTSYFTYEINSVYMFDKVELFFVVCMSVTILVIFEVKSTFKGCLSICFSKHAHDAFGSFGEKYLKTVS